MKKLQADKLMQDYLDYCKYEKNLNEKTIRAYGTDLRQFRTFFTGDENSIDKNIIRAYMRYMHMRYKTKTIKRKMASLKGFVRYLLREEIIDENPFEHIYIHMKEEKELPKIVTKNTVERLLSHMYKEYNNESMTSWARRYLLRDIVVTELLFSTGLRISELCNLHPNDIDMTEMSILIKGKGAKERIIQVGNEQVQSIFKRYMSEFKYEIKKTGFVFVTKNITRFSEQAARAMIRKYKERIGEEKNITPHMFRHAFATYLLEEDVDMRYIQKLLGHSSVSTTQIYCYVSIEKQRQILKFKNPRNSITLNIGE